MTLGVSSIYFFLPFYGFHLGDTFCIQGGYESFFSRAIGETECAHDELLDGTKLAAATEEKEFHSFEIDSAQVSFFISLTVNFDACQM